VVGRILVVCRGWTRRLQGRTPGRMNARGSGRPAVFLGRAPNRRGLAASPSTRRCFRSILLKVLAAGRVALARGRAGATFSEEQFKASRRGRGGGEPCSRRTGPDTPDGKADHEKRTVEISGPSRFSRSSRRGAFEELHWRTPNDGSGRTIGIWSTPIGRVEPVSSRR